MEKLTLQCEQCGSTDIAMLEENLAQCNHCETKFVIQKEDENDSDDAPKVFEGSFGLKIDKDLRTFEREAIINSVLTGSVPLDISADDFGEAYECVLKSASTRVLYNGFCEASIGYVKPQYSAIDDINKTDFRGDYVHSDATFDWKPYNKPFSTIIENTSALGENFSIGSKAGEVVCKCLKNELDSEKYLCPIEELGVEAPEVDEDLLKLLIERNTEDLKYSIILPGDRQKDTNVAYRKELVSLYKCAEKAYVLPCKYQGKDAKITYTASKRDINVHNIALLPMKTSLSSIGITEAIEKKYYKNQPWFGETELQKKHRRIIASRNKEKKWTKPLAIGVALAGVACFAFSVIAGIGLIATALVGSMLRSDHWSKVESKCKKELDKEFGRRSNRLTALGCYKLRNLEKILKAKGMAPLTLDDIEPYRIHLFDA